MGMAQQWLDPRCKALPFTKVTQLVELRDGRLLTVEGTATKTSRDDGKTWSAPKRIYDGAGPGIPSDELCYLMLRTNSGALVMAYLDKFSHEAPVWDAAKNEASKDGRIDVWSIRSLDEGNTWIDRQKVRDGYCGALIGMIQTSRGRIVLPVQSLFEHNRHAIVSFGSTDGGKTWQRGNVIDLGGRGDHDGALEPTVAELKNGRLLMLLRTNLDRFWEAYSDDGGRYWRELRPSQIEASSSPGWLMRLASGRLVLVWNRLYPGGKTASDMPAGWYRGSAGSQQSEAAASWYREEFSMAFSEDDAKSWTKPVVIARQPDGQCSYPYVFERRPGELWVIGRYANPCWFSLKEADFVQK
jgi:Neuraminidase (sialidase)